MDRVLIGKHDNSPKIKELEIIVTSSSTSTYESWTTTFLLHSVDSSLVQQGDVLELPTMSDGSVQRVKVRAAPVVVASDYTVTDSAAPNFETTYTGGYVVVTTDPVLIDDSPISVAQAKNELWGKKIKLISYTERQRTTDVGLYVSRPGANVLDPVQARTGNLSFDSSIAGTLRVLQRGTFRIQCKKTYMGKKGALELLSDEQNRANADYTKLYPFEVPQQSEEDYLAKSPKNANTISLGYEQGQYPQTGNGFNQEFIQNVYCDYGTTTVLFDPPLPDNIKTPHVSLHFAVANSSGHFHPWYANVTCTTGNEDYGWQYANSQHCVHMDSAWFRGKWSFRERTIAPFGTNLNNDLRSIDPTANMNFGLAWSYPDGTGIPTFNPVGVFDPTLNPKTAGTGFRERGTGDSPHGIKELNSGSIRFDNPARPYDALYGDGEGNSSRYMTDNQLGFNLPRYANPTVLPESTNYYPYVHPNPEDSSLGEPLYVADAYEHPAYQWAPYNRPAGPGRPKSIIQTLLGLADPVLFNAEPGSPGTHSTSDSFFSDLDPLSTGFLNKLPFEQEGIPPEAAVKGSEISYFGADHGMTHGRVRPPYYDPITGKPRATSSGEGIAGLSTYRHEQTGPQSYESTLSMNSPHGVWGGAFKSFAGMQGVTYFANNTHLKIDAFMTPTHTPTPFETEIVKTREVNPDAAHGDLSKFDWLGANYLGDGTTPNQEFDEFGNIRKNVGLAVDTDQKQPMFKQGTDKYKRYFADFAAGVYPGGVVPATERSVSGGFAPSWTKSLGKDAYSLGFARPGAGSRTYSTSRIGEPYLKDEYADTRSDGLGYSWSNVVHRAANSGYGLPYKEKLPRVFRTKYWDDKSPDTEYEWWPINHANGHFAIAYGTKSGGRYDSANTITSQINEYDSRTHKRWREILENNIPNVVTQTPAIGFNVNDGTASDKIKGKFLNDNTLGSTGQEQWLSGQEDETVIGSDRSKLEAQFLDESREMGFDDEDLKLYRGHPAYMAACYGDYRPIAFIGADSDSAGGSRGKNFVKHPYFLDQDELEKARYSAPLQNYFDRMAETISSSATTHSKTDLIMDNTIVQLRSANTYIGDSEFWEMREQEDEWSPFWPLLNKGTRFSNQLPNTEGKGYPSNSQYEPGDAFLKTRTFQGQPTSLDSFWNSFSNNTSQWVSSNTPYGEFYYADGGYAMDVSPYYNYGGQRYIYSAEKVEQRITEDEPDFTKLGIEGSTEATYRMMKLIPTDFNIQRQSMAKHNWHGGNPKAGVGTEGRRFGFGGAGSAEAMGQEDTFDTYIGTYVVYDLEGGGDS